MPKPAPKLPAATIERYDALVAAFPDVERKGASMPYTSLNGNMFSFLTAEGRIALRLDDDARAALLKRGGEPCVQHGAVMKEYALVPEALAKRPKELAKLFEASLRHARTLEAKPTKRKSTRRAK